jgi:Domain of unknown function (DUF4388)
VSLLGTLEQFNLSNVLQRIEAHEKTGLLVVRQGAQWVEFYFRDGRLLCIGPVRTSATLGDRLLQDKIISQQVWQETKRILASDEQSETRVALTLMERGYVSREKLRFWTIEKSLIVLRAILAWTSGEIYFEESTQPPSDRLLVAMSISSLIEIADVKAPSPEPRPLQTAPATYSTVKFNVAQEAGSFATSTPPTLPPTSSPVSSSASTDTDAQKPVTAMTPARPGKSKEDITRVPTLMEATQFLDEKALDQVKNLSTTALPETESFASFFGGNGDAGINASLPNTNEISFASLASIDNLVATPPSIQPERVMYPTQPKRIDTSFMNPDMVLIPADISAFREQNPKVQVTPDQWRILTCVDGRNSLQMVCQQSGLTPDVICVLAGELVAEGLIYVVPPEQVQIQGPAINTRDLAAPGLANGYVAPGYTANAATPWSAAVPAPSTDAIPNLPFETESQWGNGGNGATFIPGRGWITTPQPMLPLHSSGALASPGLAYAQASNGRY